VAAEEPVVKHNTQVANNGAEMEALEHQQL
jgi:hypothetical protein